VPLLLLLLCFWCATMLSRRSRAWGSGFNSKAQACNSAGRDLQAAQQAAAHIQTLQRECVCTTLQRECVCTTLRWS
jgi:hypothetical protein